MATSEPSILPEIQAPEIVVNAAPSPFPESNQPNVQTSNTASSQIPEIFKVTLASVVESLTALASDLRETVKETRGRNGNE